MKNYRSEFIATGNNAASIVRAINAAIAKAHRNDEELEHITVGWGGDPTGSGYTAALDFMKKEKKAA